MGKCSQCGICCKLFLINLTEAEYRSGRYMTIFEELGFVDNFEEAERDGANIIAQHDDESCIYLQNGQCSIHEERPQACRNFFCDSKDRQFAGMIQRIEEYRLNFQKAQQGG